MASDPLFGWDLLFKTIEVVIKSKSDVLIAFTHWNLIKRRFRSIGVGDELILSGDEVKSELLPVGWNDTEGYKLRYVLEDKLYILHGVMTDNNIVINLMRVEDMSTSSYTFNTEDTIENTKGALDVVMPKYNEVMFKINRDIIDTITNKPTSTVQTQTTSVPERNYTYDPSRLPPPSVPNPQPDLNDLWVPPSRLSNVGRSDLDPFSPMGSGMIFNPFGQRGIPQNPGQGIPGGLPRGAVPPGARFDPFGPPGVPMPGRRPPPPDSDHLPPPGFDDMFM